MRGKGRVGVIVRDYEPNQNHNKYFVNGMLSVECAFVIKVMSISVALFERTRETETETEQNEKVRPENSPLIFAEHTAYTVKL